MGRNKMRKTTQLEKLGNSMEGLDTARNE